MSSEPVPGQEVLVDTEPYGLSGERWCSVTRIVYGDAASYPVRVKIPGKGNGQFKVSELRGVRWPPEEEQ